MNTTVQIVECGRGPQLSTSRITVQDLVPYLQKKWTYEQIMVAMPILTVADIQAVEGYVRENYDAVMEGDRRIRERNANRKIPPEIEEIRRRGHAKLLALKEQFAKQKKQEGNGDLLLADANITGHVDHLVRHGKRGMVRLLGLPPGAAIYICRRWPGFRGFRCGGVASVPRAATLSLDQQS